MKIRVEKDRSDNSWIVTKYHRRGWNVLHRCETIEEAHDHAAREVEAAAWNASNGR
jgi:hypothetical protein